MSGGSELKGRRNRAFAAIKTDLEERQRLKKTKSNKVLQGCKDMSLMQSCAQAQVEEVTYVDAARNMAVVLGERDVKTDVKAKNRSGKQGARG